MILLTPNDKIKPLIDELLDSQEDIALLKSNVLTLQNQRNALVQSLNSIDNVLGLTDERLQQSIAVVQQEVTTNNETFVEVVNGLNARLNDPKSLFTLANAGVWTKFKTLEYTLPSSGNRSIQIRSASGSINVRWNTNLNWDNSGNIISQTATIAPTSTQYLRSDWNFGGAGNMQTATVEDLTNKKIYRAQMLIGSNYQGNSWVIQDIT
jgi:hypothetical protein